MNQFTKLWSIQLSDWWRALVIAIIAGPLGILYDWATMTSYQFSWKSLLKGAIAGGAGYLIKNFITGEYGKILSNKIWIGFIFGLLCLCSVSAQAMQATLAWDPNTETDLNGYKMYYGLTAGGPYTGTGATEGGSPIVILLTRTGFVPTAPEFTLRNLDGLKAYFFVVTATDTEGLESGNSNQVTVGPVLYVLTTSVVGTGGTIAPPTGPFTIATIQTVTATPLTGYRVKAWTGTNDNTSKANTNTVTMTANKTVTVSFELIPQAPAVPKNLRTISVVAEGVRTWQLASDPILGAETVSYYVVGSEWQTVPYIETTYKNKPKAIIVPNLGSLDVPVSLYYKASSSVGETPTKHLTVQRSTYVYDYLNSTSVLDTAMWW